MARPRKEISDAQIVQIEKLAAALPLHQIADVFGISDSTLRRRMEEDPRVLEAYKRGKANVDAQIAGSLVQKALNGDTTSQIFYLKTQCGWRETTRTENVGEGGGPIRQEHIVRFIRPQEMLGDADAD